jgi:FkbM family methyltransferase
VSLMEQLEKRGDLWWPKADHGCWEWMHADAGLPDALMAHCRQFRTVIVAGANAGFYIAAYASRFERVIAVEPEPVNFLALTLNCPQPNVIKVQAALGNVPGGVSVRTECDGNRGGFYVTDGGMIPTLLIDDFDAEVDAIHLDVEGYEVPALLGADLTIAAIRPAIMVESIGNGERYGYDNEAVEKRLHSWGYVAVENLKHDTIYKWGGA